MLTASDFLLSSLAFFICCSSSSGVMEPAPIVPNMPQFAAAAKQLEPVDSSVWSEFRQRARTSYEEDIKIVPSHWALDMGKIMAVLREFLPRDVIITNDAGTGQ